MPVHNADITVIFEEIADLLEIEGANPFRIRAYRNAARILGDLPQEARVLVERGDDLTACPASAPISLARSTRSSAPDIAACSIACAANCRRDHRTAEDTRTGTQAGQDAVPRSRRADRRTTAARSAGRPHPRAARLRRKNRAEHLQAVQVHASQSRRFKLATAAQYADTLRAFLQAIPGVQQVVVAGSFRRMRETVGDLDILVTATADSPVMQRFTAYDEVVEVFSAGETRASILLKCACRSICASSRKKAMARHCTTSPAPSRTTSRSAASRSNSA